MRAPVIKWRLRTPPASYSSLFPYGCWFTVPHRTVLHWELPSQSSCRATWSHTSGIPSEIMLRYTATAVHNTPRTA